MYKSLRPASIRDLIAGYASSLKEGAVCISDALFRISTQHLQARISVPNYDQSIRDGFVLAYGGYRDGLGREFPVIGEAPAGKVIQIVQASGTACRIMTGGMIPEGGTRVVPQEDCLEADGMVMVPAPALQRKNTYIQKKGEQIAEGEVLVEAGTILQPEHLALLAAGGYSKIEVFARPRVGFFSTGSELVDSAEQLVPGLKISANRPLLAGLIKQFLADGEDLGIVGDTWEELQYIFARIQSAGFDVVISTGGMGPGKYDLLEEAFCQAGGEVIFRSLAMRPGRSTLFGRLGRALFFGLPGPPEAVRTLMNELVGPTLLRLQGVKESDPVTLQARLEQRMEMRNTDVLHIKAGILTFRNGLFSVRPTGRLEIPSCFILFPPERNVYEAGSEVEVHLAYSPGVSQLFAAT